MTDLLVADAAGDAGTTQLAASRCGGCGRVEFPGRDACPACGTPAVRFALGCHATLAGFTWVLHAVPGGLVEPPYGIGVARFAEGISVMGLLVDPPAELRIGMALDTVAVDGIGEHVTYGFRVA